MSKQDHTYRKKDVTGALGFVRSLFADLWEAMPEADRPRTDREAASTFFQVDRSNSNMAEFLEQLQAHNVAELGRLSDLKRKPPKRAGPRSLTLPAAVYDELRALAIWVDATPASVELGDHAWDAINALLTDPLDEYVNSDEYVCNVQIETDATRSDGTKAGMLVALMETDVTIEREAGEIHVELKRGK